MSTIKGKISALAIAGFLMLTFAQPALAQIVDCGRTGQAQCEWTDLFELAYRVVNYMIGMAGFVAVLFIVWGGVQMLLSAGNTTTVQEAKSTIKNAILGLVLTMLAYLIIGYVVGLLVPGVGGGDPLRNLMDYLPNSTSGE